MKCIILVIVLLALFVAPASAMAPVANFTSNITDGSSPLPVSFTDLSSNTPLGWAWYFGEEDFSSPWTEISSNAEWSAREDFSSVTLQDGSIVLMGGNDGSFKNDVWRSTDNGATWTEMISNAGWTARSRHSSVALPDDSIVLMGGFDGSNKNDVWRSTDNGATWTEMNSSAGWTARILHSSVVLPDGSIVLMGGSDGSYKNDVWRSTDNGATWTETSSDAEWPMRYAHSSVTLPDGSIVLMGGFNGNYKTDVWRSTDNGATWTEMNANANWTGSSRHSSVALPDGSIVLMGGYNGSRKDDVWRSIDNGVTWNELNSSPGWTARFVHSSVALPDGSIVLMGGNDNTHKNDVWRFTTSGSSEQNPAHTYVAPGSYKVVLQTYNSKGYNSTTKTSYITIADVPVANFTSNKTSGDLPLTVNFTDLSTNSPTSWLWNFGDGNSSADQHPTHTYVTAGDYNVSLNATNTAGSNFITRDEHITVFTVPVANFTSNVTSGALPLSVSFNDTSTNVPTSWLWSFGDGNSSTDQNVTHTYSAVGTYNVSLNATNVAGSNLTTQTSCITVAIAPVANFTADFMYGTAPLAVSFSDLSTNTPTSWTWNFGDGTSSASQNPTHTYTSAGTYNVSLNTSNAGGSNISMHAALITVTASSSSPGSSNSGSRIRTSVSQGQSPKIVESTVSSIIRVTGGTKINYDFSGSGTPVLGISFDAKNDEGLVVAKVQVLSESPQGVAYPSGISYQLVSIDVGSEGTISTGNADNIRIQFKVSKEWVEQNNIDVSTIRMERYHGKQWADLPTYQEKEDDEYIYFYTQAPGFSIFSVVGDELSETSDQTPASAPMTEEEIEPVKEEEEETKDTPGFTGMLSLAFVSLAFFVFRKHEQ